jgi:hypothetical protein
MNGWALEDVRNLSVEDYDELVLWLRDEAARATRDDEVGSIDMDVVVAAATKGRTDEGG